MEKKGNTEAIIAFAKGGAPPNFRVTESDVLNAIPVINQQYTRQALTTHSHQNELKQSLHNAQFVSSLSPYRLRIKNTKRDGDGAEELGDIVSSLEWSFGEGKEGVSSASVPGWSLILNVMRYATSLEEAQKRVASWIPTVFYIVGNATDQAFSIVLEDLKTETELRKACDADRISFAAMAQSRVDEAGVTVRVLQATLNQCDEERKRLRDEIIRSQTPEGKAPQFPDLFGSVQLKRLTPQVLSNDSGLARLANEKMITVRSPAFMVIDAPGGEMLLRRGLYGTPIQAIYFTYDDPVAGVLSFAKGHTPVGQRAIAYFKGNGLSVGSVEIY